MGFAIYTLPEAAKEARISPRSLHTLLSAGKGPAVTRVGHKRLIRSDQLRAWLERCTDPQPLAKAA